MSDKNGFWDQFTEGFTTTSSNAMDEFLKDGLPLEGDQFKSMRGVAEKGKKEKKEASAFHAGSRVAFDQTLESIFTYDDIPGEGVEGSVVAVRTAHGNTTIDPMDRLFILWDDGKLRSISANHLKAAKTKQASKYRIVASDDIVFANFFTVAGGHGDELVHKATKDLWSLKQDGESFVLERLFSEEGKPLKA